MTCRTSYALVLLALLGCARSGGDRPVLRISNWGGAGEDSDYDRLVQKMYEDFGKQHHVAVRVEGIPDGYVQKMLLNHIAGTMPDVMQVDASSSAIFVNNGVLADLTPLIQHDPAFKLSDYYPNTLAIGRRGDKLYTIPGDFTPMVVYYNKRMFDRAGVPCPDGSWNFAQFLEVARKLTIPGKQYGFVFTNWMPGWVMWLWNNGGEVLSPNGKRAAGFLDSPKNVESVTFLRDLVKKYQVAPSLSQTASMGVDPFVNGQAAMTVSGHWSLTSYKAAPMGRDGKPTIEIKDLGIAAMPHNTPKSQTVMYEMGFGIPVQCKQKALAWESVKTFAGYPFQKVYNSSGIAIDGRIDVSRERATQEIEKEFLKIVPSARPPAGSWVEGYEAVEDIGGKMIDRVLNADVPVETALHDAAARVDKEFGKR